MTANVLFLSICKALTLPRNFQADITITKQDSLCTRRENSHTIKENIGNTVVFSNMQNQPTAFASIKIKTMARNVVTTQNVLSQLYL